MPNSLIRGTISSVAVAIKTNCCIYGGMQCIENDKYSQWKDEEIAHESEI